MSLNIKNDETCRLAQQLAMLTGQSMTAAITQALRLRLDNLRRQEKTSLTERLLSIGKDCAAHLKEPFYSIDHGDLLYDKNGLPK